MSLLKRLLRDVAAATNLEDAVESPWGPCYVPHPASFGSEMV